jgi:uncharacterized protein YukE
LTPYQLRQLADRKRAEADALTASASRLRTTADSFRDLLEGIPDQSRRVWQGPAATDFEDRAQAAARDLSQQAQVLSSTAIGFDRESADLRAEARVLDMRAAAEEAATIPGGSAPPPTSVW